MFELIFIFVFWFISIRLVDRYNKKKTKYVIYSLVDNKVIGEPMNIYDIQKFLCNFIEEKAPDYTYKDFTLIYYRDITKLKGRKK